MVQLVASRKHTEAKMTRVLTYRKNKNHFRQGKPD